MDKLPLLDLDFRTTYVENNVLYTPSKGSLVTRAVMGTGVPGNTWAPSITSVGASFDGGDYINTNEMALIGYNIPYTLVIRGRFAINGNAQRILSNYNNGAAWGMLRVQAGGALEMSMSDSGAHFINAISTALAPRAPCTYAVTYDGSGQGAGILLYINGQRDVGSVGGTSLSSSIDSGASFNIGRHPTGVDFLNAGTSIRRFIVYPFALSPSQVRAIHEKFEREGES